jgi:hypothetical protein
MTGIDKDKSHSYQISNPAGNIVVCPAGNIVVWDGLGVILLNEVGMDPGINHMLVMRAVDSIHSRGGHQPG